MVASGSSRCTARHASAIAGAVFFARGSTITRACGTSALTAPAWSFPQTTHTAAEIGSTRANVSAISVLSVTSARNCLGFFTRESGQNRVPLPPARMTACRLTRLLPTGRRATVLLGGPGGSELHPGGGAGRRRIDRGYIGAPWSIRSKLYQLIENARRGAPDDGAVHGVPVELVGHTFAFAHLDAQVLRLEKLGERQLVQRRDLGRAGRPRIPAGGGEGERIDHADERRDHVPGDEGGTVVELADQLDVLRPQTHFLARFPQRRLTRVRVGRVHRAARKADLAGVRPQLLAPLGEEHGEPVRPRQERHQHRRRPAELRIELRLVRRERRADLRQRHLLPDSHSSTTAAA